MFEVNAVTGINYHGKNIHKLSRHFVVNHISCKGCGFSLGFAISPSQHVDVMPESENCAETQFHVDTFLSVRNPNPPCHFLITVPHALEKSLLFMNFFILSQVTSKGDHP